MLILAACGSAGPSVSADAAADAAATSSSTTTTLEEAASAVPSATEPDTSPEPAAQESEDESAVEVEVPEGQQCVRIDSFDNGADRWVVVNDGVMGGLSEGSAEFDDGVLTFSGFINTNGGGFSLVRSSRTQDVGTLAEGLTGAEFLVIRARSSIDRSFVLIVEDEASSGTSLMYFTNIALEGSEWVDTIVPLTDLEGRFFGNPAPDVPPVNVDETVSFGIILADGVDGDFEIEVDHIDACSVAIVNS